MSNQWHPYWQWILRFPTSFARGYLKQELRPCYPRDIVEQVCWAARYDNREPYIDRSALDQAIRAYFADGGPVAQG